MDMSHTEPQMVDQHYTVAEVAKLLRVHEMTVRQWYVKKGLRIQKVGRKGVRIAAWDLKMFLAQFDEKRNSGPVVARLSQPGSQENTITYEQRKEGISKET